MASTSGEKELKTDYPVEEGLTARTTKQTGRIMNLIPENESIVVEDTKGIR